MRKRHLKYTKDKESVIVSKELTPFDEFLLALQNEIPSYYCRFENHTRDNHTISFIPKQLFDNIERENCKLLGVCIEPEYQVNDFVGFLFEDQQTFKQFWYHGPALSTYRWIIDVIKGEI